MIKLLDIFIVASGSVSAFAFTQAVSVPFVMGAIFFICVLLAGRLALDRNAIFLLCFFSLPACISAGINIESSSQKTLAHLASYILTPLLYYVAVISMLRISRRPPYKVIAFALIANLIYVLVEFAASNTGQMGFLVDLPRPAVQEYQPTVAGSVVRARGLAEESAHFMLYAGIFYFLSCHGKRVGTKTNLTFFVASVATFGVAAWLAMIASFLVVGVRRLFSLRLIVIGFLLAILIFLLWEYFEALVMYQFFFKLSSLGGSDRADRFFENLQLYTNSSYSEILFGMGPGYYERAGVASTVSLPALTLFQNGLIGLISLVIIFAVYYLRALRKGADLARAVVFSAVCYLSISNYWFPWLWMLFAVIDYEDRNSSHRA